MRKVIVNEFMSLDGVVQAPGGPEEDAGGGFRHGGWQMDYSDDLGHQWVLEYIEGAGGFLLGRRTYEIFAGYWPNASEDQQVIAEPLNTKPKFVATTTLSDPLEWQNSTVLQGELAEAVTALKQEDGGDLHVIGSAQLVRSLIELDLLDELRLSIHPLVLGGGKGILPADGALRRLRLVDCETSSTGVIFATYARTED
jgi:dihydrofolate reductase